MLSTLQTESLEKLLEVSRKLLEVSRKLLGKMREVKCSKCGVTKERDKFYATGRVCRECKRASVRENYVKNRTISPRVSDALSNASEDSLSHCLDDSYRDYVTSQINDLEVKVLHAISNVTGRLDKIEVMLGNLCRVLESRTNIVSHPITDIE